MKDKTMEHKLRQETERLLTEGTVDCIVGFAPGSLKFTTTPLVTRDKKDIGNLVINPFMTSNLAKFLTEIKGKVAVVAKGCDGRSIISLMQDNKVNRGNLVILGVPCPGLINLARVEKLTGKSREQISEITLKDNYVRVKHDRETKEFPREAALYDSCLACISPTPNEYDILLGEPRLPDDSAAAGASIKELESLPPKERWEYWKNELRRCTRCYACRNVCPICYCQRCFAEEGEPQWLSPVPRWQENLLFQVTRSLHIAGRCTDCGACERACPVNIPLRELTRKMCDLVEGLYQYKAGTDKDMAPLMTHYEQSDPEKFFK
jgi:formate dehydrogenase subunit beta